MMSKQLNKRSWLWILSSAAFIAALVVFVLWALFNRQDVIEIRVGSNDREGRVETVDNIDSNDDAQLVCYFIEPTFQLRWIHSVEKQWWEEQYLRENGGLLLTTTYIQAFGAGTPSTEALAEVKKPGYIGYQINEKLPNLNWIVSRLTQGEIDYGDHQLLIHEWVPDYSEIIIMPKAYSLIDRLQKDFCHEL